MARLRLDCRTAHRWLSIRRDTPLPWYRALPLWLHLRVCDSCTHVERSLRWLGALARRIDEE